MSPNSASTVIAVIRLTPRSAINASTTGVSDQLEQRRAHLILEPSNPALRLLDRLDVLLQYDLLDGRVELHRLEPAEVGLRPAALALRIDLAVTQEKSPQPLPRLRLDGLHVLARSGEIPNRLLLLDPAPTPP